jgi:hypothetical protein
VTNHKRKDPRSSRCSGKALTEKARTPPPKKNETREKEQEEEEDDTQLENEWDFPTRIQLQMRDGATVNLYMNKVSERYVHTRVRWQSGLIRVQTEGWGPNKKVHEYRRKGSCGNLAKVDEYL